MGLETAFIPENLIEARRLITAAHDHSETGETGLSEETKYLVERILKTGKPMLHATAVSLSDRDVGRLAGYIPYNYMGVDESNLAEVLKHRLDANSCRILYENWQEEFNNPECNELLKDISIYDDNFIGFLADKGISGETFIRVLDSRNIPLGFDEELAGKRFKTGAEFSRKLKRYGVLEGTRLDIECKRALLTICGTADYLSCSEDNVLEIIEDYEPFVLRKFVFNFLDKLSLSELQIYPAVADYLRHITGQRKSDTFKEFFEDADADTVQKYLDWINICKINSYFNEDERSRFWKQFRYLNVIHYAVSNIVILEFEKCVAVEFLGEKKGTIYLCGKEEFRELFYAQIDKMSNEDLRLFFKINKEHCIESRNHIGRWQSHIAGTILKRQFTQRVEI